MAKTLVGRPVGPAVTSRPRTNADARQSEVTQNIQQRVPVVRNPPVMNNRRLSRVYVESERYINHNSYSILVRCHHIFLICFSSG